MKVIAKERAFYKGQIIKVGTVLNIKEDKIPKWAKEIKNAKTTKENGQQTLLPNAPVVQAREEQNNPIENQQSDETQNDLSEKSEDELNKILDDLITKGLDNEIYLENTDNKTVIEQIQELQTAINKATKENGAEQ